MQVGHDNGWRRRARRLLVGFVLVAGFAAGTSPPASAAVTATFNAGVLTVFGDANNNSITISRDAAGRILVNGGAIPVAGGTPTVANTSLMQVFGQAGNDVITLDQANGTLPAANLFGGGNDDTLTGGASDDLVFGQSGVDTLRGEGGFDFLFGGTEIDTLTGGDADDQVFGEGGSDRMIWNPGDDTDLNEGGAGSDTVEVNGGGGDEQFTATANGARVRFDRVDPAPFAIDIGTSEQLVLNANGGEDSFSATGNLAALIQITVDGGAGGDTILGSNGIDLLLGGDGDDFVDGQQGNDIAFLGSATRTSSSGTRATATTPSRARPAPTRCCSTARAATRSSTHRPTAGACASPATSPTSSWTSTTSRQVDLNALGAADTLTVNDLSGTDVTEINSDLAGTIGGAAGDGQADVVIVNGTNGDDVVDVVGAGASASVLGLPARVNIANSEGANDSLVLNTLAGSDDVTATTLPAGVIKLTVDGGAADDTLLGSQGVDVFLGGGGPDFIFGDNGNDTAFMGAGDDVFQWDPGDGNDTVEGQAEADTMLFFGSNAAENIDVVANGGRVLFLRNVGAVTMDLDDVESIDFRALGGADNIVVGDLSGTDMTQAGLDLRGPTGGGDGAADTVTANGTNGDDAFGAAGDAGGVDVFGLQAAINVSFQEQANDRLTLNALGGVDTVNASSLEADGMQLTMNGGLGEDVFLGSEGGDLINGGDGDDVALMGAGNDTFVWNPGDDDDTLEGQAGADTMLFNGANVAENIDISPNGGRVLFFRNIANVTMDLNDVEGIDFNALGGADTIVVDDLSGTDVNDVNAGLAATSAAAETDSRTT